MNPENDKVGYKEVSERYQIPLGTLYCWVCLKRIPHYRLGNRYVRFSIAKLDEWMTEHFIPPATKASAKRTAEA